MIEEVRGNLLDADVDALVNTVNTVGVMGKGVALQFKQAFPENYKAYRAACQRSEVQLGEMFVFDTGRLGSQRYIINFPTKQHWRARSRLSDVESGLRDLARVIRDYQITSVAVPALGCGSGGLDWRQVRSRIFDMLGELPSVRVLVYPPAGAPAAGKMRVGTEQPRMTRGRAALLGLIDRYIEASRAERIDNPSGVSLLEIQKLMYLLQASGGQLKLAY